MIKNIIIINFKLKYILLNDITIYNKNKKTLNIFNTIILKFKNIFINIKSIIDILKKKKILILLRLNAKIKFFKIYSLN